MRWRWSPTFTTVELQVEPGHKSGKSQGKWKLTTLSEITYCISEGYQRVGCYYENKITFAFFFLPGKLVAFLENSMVHASILTITAISVERFYAICWPLRAQFICTNQRTIRIIYVLWACAVGFSLPFLVMSYTELARFHDGRQVTVCRTPVDETWKRVYVIGISILFFCVPFILLVLIYTAIALQLSVQAKALGSDADSSSIANYKLRRQVVVLMVAIIILFFICNLPIRVLSVWSIFTSKQQKVSIGFEAYLNISSFARVMFYLNSAGNPIVYNIVSSRFRESCKRILSRSKKRKIKRRRSSLIFHFDAKNRQNRSMFHKQNIRQSKLWGVN